ncbi:zinc knuckle CX2CX4HX4C containing protein, partial [Tanacetum coccineum]
IRSDLEKWERGWMCGNGFGRGGDLRTLIFDWDTSTYASNGCTNGKVNEGDDKDNTSNVNTIAAINYEFTSMMETFAGSGATDYPIGGDEGVINRDTSSATDSVAATFGVDNVASIFGVSIASLEIDNVERQAVMDAIFALCDKFMASLKQSHEYDPITDGTIPCVVSHVDETPIVQSVSVQDKPSSYVGVACVSVVKMVSTRYDNILCGYFIRKRIAFPIVEYYARNNWGKFGLTRIMMNSKGFFFEFKTIKGLEDVLENRPWMIRNSPIILKIWSLNTRLCKEELTRIPVWVKINDIPIQVF